MFLRRLGRAPARCFLALSGLLAQRALVILFRLSIADGHFDHHSPIDHQHSQDDDNLELTLALERARKSKVRLPARTHARAARGARREW